jgi:hypothetical protein
MNRPARIARILIAAAAEPPLVDFWAAILHAFPDRDIQFLGDAVEERSGDKFAQDALRMLNDRFGALVSNLIWRYPDGELERVVIQAMKRGEWNGFAAPLAREIQRLLPNIVQRVLEAKQSPVRLGTLAPGQLFHYINRRVVFRVVEQYPDNEETLIDAIRPAGYNLLTRAAVSDMVFPIDEESHT